MLSSSVCFHLKFIAFYLKNFTEKFVSCLFYWQVLEGQPVNMLVTTVFAKDFDEGNNAEVIYSVSSGKCHYP